MSKSTTQHYQTIASAETEQTPEINTHDITMSAAGRAIRDLVGIDTRERQALPPTFEELGQIQRLTYEDTARACTMEVQ